MAPSLDTEIDETLWRAPQLIPLLPGGYLHNDSVHFYFYQSPFFDKSSNNWSQLTFAQNNPGRAHILNRRETFETAVREVSGLEYMVVSDPQPPQDGVWVIHRQIREKQPGEGDKITVTGSYFVVADVVYQATSVQNILHSKLLTITTSLYNFFSTASSLPLYTPASGYTYFPVTTRATTNSQSRSQSRLGSPGLIGAPPSEANSQIVSGKATGTLNNSTTSWADEMSLLKSLEQSIRYKSEYMDENPLTGEPGSFVFSATNERVQREQQQQAKSLAASKTGQENIASSAIATPRLNSPLNIQTNIAPKKGGKEKSPTSAGPMKPKRRKSKIMSPTATTPV